MAQRYCTNCGNELGPNDAFCAGCGRPAHETAAVATPEADVDVPALPVLQEEGPAAQGGKRSSVGGTRNTFVALGITVLIIGTVAALATGSGNWAIFFFLVILCVVVVSYTSEGRDDTGDGRLLLREGSARQVSEAERSSLLEEEVGEYMRDGFLLRTRTATTAQLVKQKQFSFIWALLWFLVFGVGLIVYLIYYAAKRDEGRYVEVDGYGAVRATRQIHHVL